MLGKRSIDGYGSRLSFMSKPGLAQHPGSMRLAVDVNHRVGEASRWKWIGWGDPRSKVEWPRLSSARGAWELLLATPRAPTRPIHGLLAMAEKPFLANGRVGFLAMGREGPLSQWPTRFLDHGLSFLGLLRRLWFVFLADSVTQWALFGDMHASSDSIILPVTIYIVLFNKKICGSEVS